MLGQRLLKNTGSLDVTTTSSVFPCAAVVPSAAVASELFRSPLR